MVIVKCTYCGEEVEKEANQIKLYRNSFCNSSCAAKYNNAVSPKRQKEGEFRNCLNCQKEIYITKLDIEKALKGLKGRTNGLYCSNRCQMDYQWNNKKQFILNNGIEALAYTGENKHHSYDRLLKAIIIEQNPHGETGRACWHCGWEEENPFTGRIPIQINHIDGDPLNNKISNLEIVCPNCHSLGEFFGSRGKGGRGRKH